MKKLFQKNKNEYDTYYYFFNNRITVHVSSGDPWGKNKSTALIIGRINKKGLHLRITSETWRTDIDGPPF